MFSDHHHDTWIGVTCVSVNVHTQTCCSFKVVLVTLEIFGNENLSDFP